MHPQQHAHPPHNPFQQGSKGGRSSVSRYSYVEGSPVVKALKQACVVIVIGTILVSALSLAVPPAPVSSMLTSGSGAPRRPNTNGQLRKGGGVRSQAASTRMKSVVKKNDPPKGKKRWDASTLDNQETDDEELLSSADGVSSDESPEAKASKAQLAAKIESKTIKENEDADGVFGRKENGVDDGDSSEAAHMNVNVVDSDEKGRKKKKKKREEDRDKVNDVKVVANSRPKTQKHGSNDGGVQQSNDHEASAESEKEDAETESQGDKDGGGDAADDHTEAKAKELASDSGEMLVKIDGDPQQDATSDVSQGGGAATDKGSNAMRGDATEKKSVSKGDETDANDDRLRVKDTTLGDPDPKQAKRIARAVSDKDKDDRKNSQR